MTKTEKKSREVQTLPPIDRSSNSAVAIDQTEKTRTLWFGQYPDVRAWALKRATETGRDVMIFSLGTIVGTHVAELPLSDDRPAGSVEFNADDGGLG